MGERVDVRVGVRTETGVRASACGYRRAEDNVDIYHGNIEGLGHHRNEHVEKEDPGGDVVQTEEQLSKAFDISELDLERGERDETEQRPKQRYEGRVQSANRSCELEVIDGDLLNSTSARIDFLFLFENRIRRQASKPEVLTFEKENKKIFKIGYRATNMAGFAW